MPRLLLLTCLAAFAALALTFSSPARADDIPPVFDKRPYAEAKAAAAEDKKWFIVKATAVWCGPCKQMDKTTWRDEKVVAWLKSSAIAVQIDVDQERDLSGKLGIQAMPTMIAFKEGTTEFDRVVGYKDPGQFMDWLQGIAKGEKSIVAVQRGAAAQAPGEIGEVQARHDLARSLMQGREYDKATDEYAWVWEHSLNVPGYGGVRGSFLASDMGRLAQVHPAAKERFAALRDAKTKAIAAEKIDPQDLDDWVVLNDVVDEPQRTLEWFDKVKAEPRMSPLLQRVSFRLERLLIEHDRWADLGGMVRDPVAKLQRDHEFQKMIESHGAPAGMDEAQLKEMQEVQKRIARDKISTLYAGLLAAGREDDAAKYAAKARELDPDPALTRAMVQTALQAGQPRKQQADWLSEAAKPGGPADPLLERVRAQLGKHEKK